MTYHLYLFTRMHHLAAPDPVPLSNFGTHCGRLPTPGLNQTCFERYGILYLSIGKSYSVHVKYLPTYNRTAHQWEVQWFPEVVEPLSTKSTHWFQITSSHCCTNNNNNKNTKNKEIKKYIYIYLCPLRGLLCILGTTGEVTQHNLRNKT